MYIILSHKELHSFKDNATSFVHIILTQTENTILQILNYKLTSLCILETILKYDSHNFQRKPLTTMNN